MDAAQALSDLTEISSQIEAAVLFDGAGTVLGSTVAPDERSAELVQTANELIAAAADVQPGEGVLTQLEASTLEGSVFVVSDGVRRILATTGAEPTVGLVFYDLKSCLRSVGEEPKPKRARRKKPKEPEANGDAA